MLPIPTEKASFTLSSGRESDYYIDLRLVTLRSEGAHCIALMMMPLIGQLHVEAVGGLTLGADPIIGALLQLAGHYSYPLRGFIVRKQQKEHGTGKLIEGTVYPKDNVVLVEDVITTASSVLRAADALKKHAEGNKPVAVLSVVDRGEGGDMAIQEAGMQHFTIFTIDEIKAIAKEMLGIKGKDEDVPLCTEGCCDQGCVHEHFNPSLKFKRY